MKKILLLLFLFFMPFMVYAEETTDVTLKDLVLKKTEGYTEVLSDAEIVDNKIVLNLKMYEVGDSAEYQFVVDNQSSQDFSVDTKNLVSDNPTVVYELVGENKSNIVEKNSSKKFTLTVTYQNEVERSLFKAGKYDVSTNKLILLRDSSLINPVTGSIFLSILLTIIVLTIGMVILKNTKVKYLLFLIFLIPISTLASFEYDILLESNIIIGYVTPNPCTYDGELVQGAEYVNGQYTYRYMQEVNGYDSSTHETSWSNFEEDGWSVTLTDKESTDPVTSVLCTTINNKPIVSMQNMFDLSKTTSIDTSSFDTSNVTNMRYVFYGCGGLVSIDVTNFDTSKVTNMNCMFFQCSNITKLDLSSFDTSNVTNMQSMFYGCNGLTELDLSNFSFISYNPNNLMMQLSGGGFSSLKTLTMSNTVFPPNCYSMFGGQQSLETIIFDNADTSLVTNMSYMFQGDSSLINLDLSSFDTSSVTNMSYMFYNCTSLIELDLSDFDVRGCNQFFSMFTGTTSFKSLSLRNWVIPEVFSNVFSQQMNARSLEEIDVTGWDLSNTTNISGLFSNCSNLKNIIGLDTWDTSNITNIETIFYGVVGLSELDLSSWDVSKVTNMGSAFNSSHLEKVNLSNWDISNINVTAYGIFGWTEYLKELIMENAKFNNMRNMFYDMQSLEYISLKNADTSKATSMNSMFRNDRKLKRIDLTNIDTSNVTDMFYMFYDNQVLEELDLSSFDTSNVTNMNCMFYYNKALTELDLGSFSDSSLTNMNNMFQGCTNLVTLDISGFDFVNNSNYSIIFSHNDALTTVYVGTQEDVDIFNAWSGKPSGATAVVKT